MNSTEAAVSQNELPERPPGKSWSPAQNFIFLLSGENVYAPGAPRTPEQARQGLYSQHGRSEDRTASGEGVSDPSPPTHQEGVCGGVFGPPAHTKMVCGWEDHPKEGWY